jgi:ATP-dependent Clp protease adaptor protein ClpS
MSTQEQVLEQTSVVTKRERSLVLFNDHDNTFDFVIDVLCSVCEHSDEQAEQCAWITHYKGKCEVLSGNFDELKTKADIMADVGLTVEIH